METSLELHKKTDGRDDVHSIVVRFSVERKVYRIATGLRCTKKDWTREQQNGYSQSIAAVELRKKTQALLSDWNLSEFDITEFRKALSKPNESKDSITSWWPKYILSRKKISERTAGIDRSMFSSLKPFIDENIPLKSLSAWNYESLNSFHDFMISKNKSISTAEIYLETLRTFFNWTVKHKVISISPFNGYKITQSTNSHHPYSSKELDIILSLEPSTEKQREAMDWITLIVESGGTDMMDFATMKCEQIQDDSIHIVRTKVKRHGQSATKRTILDADLMKVIDRLRLPQGEPTDYVFGIFDSKLSPAQNLERLKSKMKKINHNINKMIEAMNEDLITRGGKKLSIQFTIKRLRPTAATIALNTTKDIHFVSQMLNHSDLSTTARYLKNMPDDVNRKNQTDYRDAIRKHKNKSA